MYTIGIYRTRALAVAAAAIWSDVYDDELIQINFDGQNYYVLVPAGE
jgi:hypothetical protein